MPVNGMDASYWNEALETRPWVEVERWQAQQVAEAVPAMRARSPLIGELHRGLPTTPRFSDLAGLAALPFMTKDDLRTAQDAATDEMPFGRNQAAPSADIVQALCSSGTTG